MSPTTEAPVCLRAQGINNDNGGVGRARQACGISDNDGGVGRVQGIHNASKGLETTAEVAGARRLDQGIYDDGGGVGRGR